MGVLDVHSVTVLVSGFAKGAAGGVNRTDYGPANPAHPWRLPCTVFPMSGFKAFMLMQQGFTYPHKIIFGTRPIAEDRGKLLTASHRLLWTGPGGNTMLRIKSPPQDKSGLNMEWTLMADALSEDNPPDRDIE